MFCRNILSTPIWFGNKVFDEKDKMVAVLIGKLEKHKKRDTDVGYIAMLTVDSSQRGKGLASKLVNRFEQDCRKSDRLECMMLDTECVNKAALGLYMCKITSSWLF